MSIGTCCKAKINTTSNTQLLLYSIWCSIITKYSSLSHCLPSLFSLISILSVLRHLIKKKKILSVLRHLIMDDKMSPFHPNSLPSHTYFFFSCHKERTKYPWLEFSTLGNRLHIPSTIYYTPATHHATINVKLNPKSFVRLFLALVYGSLER